MEIECFKSEDLEIRTNRILNFAKKLESQIIKVVCFNGETVIGLFKFVDAGYNEEYVVPSVGELYIVDSNSFDHFFFFHEIQKIEILTDPLLRTIFEERDIGSQIAD